MATLSDLDQDARELIQETIDQIAQTQGQLDTLARRLEVLCAEHGVDPGEATDTLG